jgi:hypothetical protein
VPSTCTAISPSPQHAVRPSLLTYKDGFPILPCIRNEFLSPHLKWNYSLLKPKTASSGTPCSGVTSCRTRRGGTCFTLKWRQRGPRVTSPLGLSLIFSPSPYGWKCLSFYGTTDCRRIKPMDISPYAGTPADPGILVNVPRLATAYDVNRSDPAEPSQVWSSNLRAPRLVIG